MNIFQYVRFARRVSQQLQNFQRLFLNFCFRRGCIYVILFYTFTGVPWSHAAKKVYLTDVRRRSNNFKSFFYLTCNHGLTLVKKYFCSTWLYSASRQCKIHCTTQSLSFHAGPLKPRILETVFRFLGFRFLKFLRFSKGFVGLLGFNVRRPDTKIMSLWPRNSRRISHTWYSLSPATSFIAMGRL